jgi:hypothetical protein
MFADDAAMERMLTLEVKRAVKRCDANSSVLNDPLAIRLVQRDPYTLVRLIGENWGDRSVAIAKRNPTDPQNETRGVLIALFRAVRRRFGMYITRYVHVASPHVYLTYAATEAHRAMSRIYNIRTSFGSSAETDEIQVTELDMTGPYTHVCVEYYGDRGHGFAKCSPSDPYDSLTGVSLATFRAVRDLRLDDELDELDLN